MGLSMGLYLRKHEFVSKFDKDFATKRAGFYPEELEEFEADMAARSFLSKNVDYQVGYWRKANAIHRWFVHNCADGVDECQDVYVPVAQLKKLLEVCKKTLDDHTWAPELLPTTDGFFFGGQEYDDWYFEQLEYTVDLIEKVLKVLKNQEAASSAYYDVYYRASW